MPLLSDGKITIPLYHGTNLLFYESIKRHGLSGLNLIKELCVIELLRELIAICDDSLPDEEDWILRMQSAKFIASQDVTGGGFNFRHGSAYLAASIQKAVRYAISSEFSSEALAQFMMLWNRLEDRRIIVPEAVVTRSKPIVEFASGKKAPLVLQLSDVPICDLTAENGSDPTACLNLVRQLASSENPVYEHLLGAVNFELHKPTSIADAKIFGVLRASSNDSSHSENYSLIPYRGDPTFDGPTGEVVHLISLP